MSDNNLFSSVTEDQFREQVLKSTVPTVVRFWAPWCEISASSLGDLIKYTTPYKEKVNTAQVNVDECPKLVKEFAVKGVPTLLLFKEGKVVERILGEASWDFLYRVIQNLAYNGY